MNSVYVIRYSLSCGTELVSCYDSMSGVISRLKTMEIADTFIEDESIHIEKMEIITDEEAANRFKNLRKHYSNK